MDDGFLIASNIIVPLITGLFFFIYFGYFVIINNTKAPSFKYFIIFLLSFSLFLVGRPLQLMLGPYPIPLIIVNIRLFIFCSLSITSMIIASNIFNHKKYRKVDFWIFFSGILFGLVYVIFNTLGTIGSYQIFTWGNLVAYDNLTPASTGPFYGREVTILVQIMIGIILLVFSSLKIIMAKYNQKKIPFFKDKNILFNIGIFLFALTFIIGSFTKQWWLYYFFSMFSAFLFGTGVVMDLKEVHNNYEKLVPFIKEDIIQNMAFSNFSKLKLIELLECLDKDCRLDTFVIIMMKDPAFETKYEINKLDNITKIIKKKLDILIGNRNYIIIPLDNKKIGIVYNLLNNPGADQLSVVELLEVIQQEISKTGEQQTAIGIGRSYQNIEDLRTSYHEAQNALEYAARLKTNAVIHVNNIQPEKENINKYPTNEKLRLLSAIKIGDFEESKQALDDFLNKFKSFTKNRPEILKIRLYELIGSFSDTAILSGGDEKQLNELIKEYFNDINYITNFQMAEKWLTKVNSQIIKIVSNVHKDRSTIIIEKAKDYIVNNYNSQIGYKDVAKELFISSSYFLSLFKQETGTTFVDYLTKLRIDKSKELLVNSPLSITQISYEIGINNPNYFSSIFKKTTGVSAKDFRSRHHSPKS